MTHLNFNDKHLVFSKKIEFINEGEGKTNKQMTLSKGASEKNKPLPIISTLAHYFFQLWKEESDLLFPRDDIEYVEASIVKPFHQKLKETSPSYIVNKLQNDHSVDISLYFEIMEKSMDTLNIQRNKSIVYSKRVEEHFIGVSDNIKYNVSYSYPFIFELLNLFIITACHYKGNRKINLEIEKLYISYVEFLNQKLGAYNVKASITEDPLELYKKRTKSLNMTPYHFVNKGKHSDQLIPSKGADFGFSFAYGYSHDLLHLAWGELICAQNYNMPISLCTYCGEVYFLSGKNNKKMTCDKSECKKTHKRQKDILEREVNREAVKKRDRIRQQRHRKKKKATKLFKEGISVKEISEMIDYDIKEITKWVNEKE